MACDVSVNQSRLKFQNFEPQNSPCSAQMGFKLDGTLARDFWLSSVNPQVDPRWLWLNPGGLLAYREEDAPNAVYNWLLSQPVRRAQLRFFGQNEILLCPTGGEPSTVWAQLELQVLDVFGPSITDEEEARFCKLIPPNNTTWLFENFETIIPPDTPESSIVAPLLITPLMACHDCSNPS